MSLCFQKKPFSLDRPGHIEKVLPRKVSSWSLTVEPPNRRRFLPVRFRHLVGNLIEQAGDRLKFRIDRPVLDAIPFSPLVFQTSPASHRTSFAIFSPDEYRPTIRAFDLRHEKILHQISKSIFGNMRGMQPPAVPR
jgi:hypothetical protein